MDRAQFINLVNGEQEQLRKFLLALCTGKRDEADDIAQEALVKAYLSSSGYQDEGKFTAWLYKIAYNTFLDHMKLRRTSAPLDACKHLSDGTTGYSVKEISKIVECTEDAVKKQLPRGREHLRQKMGSWY